ncbi:hypothetical protein U1Q18_018529 [Sarracenia purpurea var. burkii]
MKETKMKEKLNRARMILLQLMRKLNQSMVKEKMKLLQEKTKWKAKMQWGAGPNSDLAEWIEIPVIDEEAAEDESAEKGVRKLKEVIPNQVEKRLNQTEMKLNWRGRGRSRGQIDPTDSLDCSSNAVNAEVFLNPEKMDGVRKIQIGEKGEHPDTIRKVLDDML